MSKNFGKEEGTNKYNTMCSVYVTYPLKRRGTSLAKRCKSLSVFLVTCTDWINNFWFNLCMLKVTKAIYTNYPAKTELKYTQLTVDSSNAAYVQVCCPTQQQTTTRFLLPASVFFFALGFAPLLVAFCTCFSFFVTLSVTAFSLRFAMLLSRL